MPETLIVIAALLIVLTIIVANTYMMKCSVKGIVDNILDREGASDGVFVLSIFGCILAATLGFALFGSAGAIGTVIAGIVWAK